MNYHYFEAVITEAFKLIAEQFKRLVDIIEQKAKEDSDEE